MNLKLPIISFDVSFNRETTKNKAIYFNNTYELVKKIRTITYAQLNDIKYQMLQIARVHYTWKLIAKSYVQLFKETCEEEKLILTKKLDL